MDYRHIVGLLSVILQISCLLPYFIKIFQRVIHPHIFTWFLWSLLSGITLAVQLYEHAGAGAWLSAVNTIECLSVAVLAFWFGKRHIAKTDWFCLTGALMAIPVWLLTNNPFWSVLIVCGINLLGCLPTFRKSWHHPKDDYAMTFFLGGVSSLLSVIALEHFTLTTALYPLWIMISNFTLVLLILARSKVVNN
jgi:hypothetical protein